MAKITRHGGPSDKTSPDFDPEAENATPEQLGLTPEPLDLRDAETRVDPESESDRDGEETPDSGGRTMVGESGPELVTQEDRDKMGLGNEVKPTPPVGAQVTTVTSGTAEVEHEPVKEGSISEVTSWVGTDWVKAERALKKEQESDTPRKSLIALLEKTISEHKPKDGQK